MNGGIIASRYAAAFFRWTDSRSTADAVYPQVRTLLSAMSGLPEFNRTIAGNSAVSPEEKVRLLNAALGEGKTLHPDFEMFWKLMSGNGRSAYFRLALLDYLQEYRKARGLVMVQVTSASADTGLVPLIEEKIRKDYGMTAVVNQRVDSSLIGGFMCESWGWKVDASVRHALQQVKKGMTVNEKKLV